MYGRWVIPEERLTVIQTLEKLLGSQSLVSAVGTAYTLRSTSVISLSLLALWLLSPLGGQSSLRLLHETNSIESEPGTVYYADHEAPLALNSLPNWFTIVPAILSASLASSAKAKVHSNFTGDWIQVDQNSDLTYSSFTGINVQGLRSDGTSEFQIKSNYLRLACSKYTGGTNEEVHDFRTNSTALSIYPSFETLGYSDPQKTTSEDYFDVTSFFIRFAWDTKPDDNFGDTANMSDRIEFFNGHPISYLYGANFNLGSIERTFQVYKCTPRLVTVDAQVECHSEACTGTELRPAMRERDEQLGSHCTVSTRQNQACLTTATWALETFFNQLTTALGDTFASTNMNPFDDWIAGSNETYRTTTHDYARNLSSISDEMISDRLTVILNTYFQAGSWGPQITRAGLLDTPVYPYIGPDFAPERWLSTTNATFSRQVPVYKADVGWILTLLSITVVLLLLSVLNVVVSFATIAPDLFYYASSLARENPYVNTPDGGTGLGGAERSRLLKEMKVQIADVSPDSQVGYVVLKSVDTGEGFQLGRLRKDRMYW
ncbi:hypothetical protein N0V94_008453 [Neodidymelliopsis sp. IMI 364377]|nr:hypothetical protein N0V94_008453 [Neodidymelliopsis sp. IMI 364377]